MIVASKFSVGCSNNISQQKFKFEYAYAAFEGSQALRRQVIFFFFKDGVRARWLFTSITAAAGDIRVHRRGLRVCLLLLQPSENFSHVFVLLASIGVSHHLGHCGACNRFRTGHGAFLTLAGLML